MTFTVRGGPLGDAKACAFAAVLIVLAGYAFVFRAGEARIADQREINERLASQLRSATAEIAMLPALEGQRSALQRRVDATAAEPDATASTARFLADATRIANRRHTTFATIAASGTPATHGVPPHGRGEPSAPIALDVTLEGGYADVLATMRELSAGRAPAAVDLAAIARKSVDAPDATVSVSLRVAIERLDPPRRTGDVRARPK